jgi:hypothetical protein
VNINQSLVNRALAAIGEDPLVFSDERGQTLRYRVIKEYYLQTFLEALSEVAWTGGRKRARLAKTGIPHRPPEGYRFVYDVPFDWRPGSIPRRTSGPRLLRLTLQYGICVSTFSDRGMAPASIINFLSNEPPIRTSASPKILRSLLRGGSFTAVLQGRFLPG